jgi:hypothetical protein
MPIDLASVNWIYVGVLAVFVFIATFIGNLLSFGNRSLGAFLSALAFMVLLVFWSYYPHEKLPLPTSFSGQTTPVTAPEPMTAEPAGMPKQAAPPQRPSNPVTDVTPPKNPVTTITPPANKPQ